MHSKEKWKVYGNVFSEHSLWLLFKLSSQGYFEELESPISIGKEANIFTAITKDSKRIIAKIYRLENCNFNKMYDYIKTDMRFLSLKKKKRLIVFSWTQREYRNLMLAREAIKVPTPLAFKDNIILMEFIGNENPAPLLKDSMPKSKKEREKIFKKVTENMRRLYKKGLVHGDLSEYNILNHNNEPVFIDFSQSTTTDSPNAWDLLKRDVKNICNFFGKYIEIDEKEVLKKILK